MTSILHSNTKFVEIDMSEDAIFWSSNKNNRATHVMIAA